MAEHLLTLGMLILLQAVLGLDNLLYITLESQRVAKEDQKKVRIIGIVIAMVLRIVLLFTMINVIQRYSELSIFNVRLTGVFTGAFTLESVIFLLGGIFIIYTAMKEIWHMLSLDEENSKKRETVSKTKAILLIVLMNIVFSFDSILSAMALTNEFWVMAVAIMLGALLMIWLSDKVAIFLQKNKMYEVLGLFILLVVGIMLVSEGGEKAHMELFNNKITHMSKSTFYFVIFIMVIVDIVQSRYQKNLLSKEKFNQ